MKFSAISFALLASVVVVSASGFAQESDYNQGLKQELKQEDAMTVTPKKVVKKKIRKVDKSQANGEKPKTKKYVKKTVRTKTRIVKKEVAPVEVAKDETQTPEEVKNPKVYAAGLENTEPAQSVPSEGPVVYSQPGVGQMTSGQQPVYGYQPQVQPIYIFSQPPPGAIPQNQAVTTPAVAAVAVPGATPSAQVQPSTTVEATAVPEPHSEELRKQREEVEHQTENTLMEKLENDRLSAERERAQRIMGVPEASPSPSPSPSPAPVVAPVVTPVTPATPTSAAPVVAPVQAAAVTTPAVAAPVATDSVATPEEKAELDANPVYGPAPAPAPEKVDAGPAPVAAANSDADKTKVTADGEIAAKGNGEKPADEEEFKHFSLGGLAGVGSYPTVGNITGAFAAGALGQYRIDQHIAIQSTFDFSNYSIQNPSFCSYCGGGALVKNLDQYNFTAGANYSFLTGKITPVAGALLSYTRRSYSNQIAYGYTYDSSTGSNAFDGGLMAGVDFRLSKSIVLGAQFQYFWNISYKTDDPLAYGGIYGQSYGDPIESLSYYFATINLRFEL